MAHHVYEAIVGAVKTGSLREPFSKDDFRAACPGFGGRTYNASLWKHRARGGYRAELPSVPCNRTDLSRVGPGQEW